MPALSYNEEQHRQIELRHLFMPSGYGLVSEIIIAVVALIIFNLSTLSDQLVGQNIGVATSPLTIWGDTINKLVGTGESHAGVQRGLLFMLWAIAGALIYILLFRFIQLFIRTRSSVRQGALLIQTEHSRGAVRYFSSLHDFLVRSVIIVAGIVALLIGVLVCFAIASQELNNGLHDAFPDNLIDLLLAFVGAFLAVRVIVIGISLLSQRFRIWYNS